MAKNKHIGSNFDDFLRDEGILDEVNARVQKRIIAEQIRSEMKRQNISEAALAKRMETSRTVVRDLLNPEKEGATLITLTKAAIALGQKLSIRFEPQKRSCLSRIRRQAAIGS